MLTFTISLTPRLNIKLKRVITYYFKALSMRDIFSFSFLPQSVFTFFGRAKKVTKKPAAQVCEH